MNDDGKWVVNGTATDKPFVALDYFTVGPKGTWLNNGSDTGVRAVPESGAGDKDVIVTSVVEKARTVSFNFSDGTSNVYPKKIDWGMYVKKETNDLFFYMGHNDSNNWIRYRFYYRKKTYTEGAYPCYYDNWGLGQPMKATRSGSNFTNGDVLFLNGEAEAAVQLEDARGAKTYSGGTLHGWENIYLENGKRCITIKVDDVEVAENATFALKAASKIEIEQKTKLARAYSLPGFENAVANVVKHWVFENGTVTIFVEYQTRQELTFYQAKFGMFCVKRRLVDKGMGDYVTNMAWKNTTPHTIYDVSDGWKESGGISSCDHSANRIEEFGECGVTFAMQFDGGTLKPNGGFNIGTNGNNYNKINFDICGNYTAAQYEKLSSTVHWEIDYVSDYDI